MLSIWDIITYHQLTVYIKIYLTTIFFMGSLMINHLILGLTQTSRWQTIMAGRENKKMQDTNLQKRINFHCLV